MIQTDRQTDTQLLIFPGIFFLKDRDCIWENIEVNQMHLQNLSHRTEKISITEFIITFLFLWNLEGIEVYRYCNDPGKLGTGKLGTDQIGHRKIGH